MKKIRVAFIGTSHVHINNLSMDMKKHEDKIEIVGIAEPEDISDEEMKIRKKLNFPKDFELKIWGDYKELLRQDIDVAVITTDIKAHTDIACVTLGMGIHTVLEKPMALDMESAKRMYRAYKKSTAELIINWPIAWFPAFNKVKELADSGVVGDVLRVQYRSPSTRGPYKLNEYTAEELSKMWWYKHECGGGSISDYAGYGCVLTTWITNKIAKRVSGIKKNFFLPFSDVEDYSVFIIDFEDCVGLIEGSWSTMSNGQIPTGPIVYGTEGVIVGDRYDKEVKVYKELKPYVTSPGPDEVYTAEDNSESLLNNLIGFILEGKPLHELITAEFNMKVMAAFDAGIRSCESKNTEDAQNPFQF